MWFIGVTLISGYVHSGFVSESLGILVEMQDCWFEPDPVALLSALLACSQIRFLMLRKSVRHGEAVHRHMVRSGFGM